MNHTDTRRRRRIPLWLLVLGVCCGVTAFFWAEQDFVATAAAAVVTLAAFSGYRIGAVRLTGFFGGVAAAALLAPAGGRILEPKLAELFHAGGSGTRALAVLVVGLGLMLAVMISLQLLGNAALRQRPALQSLNQWTGFAIGAVQGSLLVLLVASGLLFVEPIAKNRLYSDAAGRQHDLSRGVAQHVLHVAAATRRSAINPLIKDSNPFEKIESLRRLRQSLNR